MNTSDTALTLHANETAEGGEPIEQSCPAKGVKKPNPWWYAALPITIPLDIISISFAFYLEPISTEILKAMHEEPIKSPNDCLDQSQSKSKHSTDINNH